jgi:hypothetical protein
VRSVADGRRRIVAAVCDGPIKGRKSFQWHASEDGWHVGEMLGEFRSGLTHGIHMSPCG